MKNNNNDIAVKVVCKDCGKEFTISSGELSWLTERGFEPFKRCAECRKKKKASNAAKRAKFKKQPANGGK